MMLKKFILIGIAIIAFYTQGCNDLNVENVITPSQKAPICKVGDILTEGQSCTDPNTDALFSVTQKGNGKYTSDTGLLYEATDVLDTIGTTLNGNAYNFKATKQNNGSWKVETVTH
ncbi:MAG: hypothetical protein OXI24_12260 [Candidatus Poribacteria bacterium]|nr:hypothetical protein [Candidatus Poribacteria bacterium]